jgi:tRNA(fMet)-specific endonuclease VapC
VRYLLDTSILIPFRDGDDLIAKFVDGLGEAIFASVVSQVELEGGVYRDVSTAQFRRVGLAQLLRGVQVLPLTRHEAKVYGQIVAQVGYSRRKILDRMIAAQALVAEATLVTLNPEDFADIPNLKVHSL